MKTDKEFADSVRRKANEYKRKEKKRRKAFAISATSFLLVVAITLGTVLPIALGGEDGGEPTDYLASFTATIERQPLNGMAGYDASVWDYDKCEWLNEYEYDAVLGDYPKSISAYLAYLLETNKSSGLHFWVKIECLNHESSAVRDLFVETMQSLDVPTDRTVLSYDDGEVGGLTGLWTRNEILDFAKRYEEQCPNNIYRKDGVRYVAGITVNITYELSELGSKYMSYYMANSFDSLEDSDVVAVEVVQTIELTRDEIENFSESTLQKMVSTANDSLLGESISDEVRIKAEYSKYHDMYLNGNTGDIANYIGTEKLIQMLQQGGCNASVIFTDYCSQKYYSDAFYFYVDNIEQAKEIDIDLFENVEENQTWMSIFFSYDIAKVVKGKETLAVYGDGAIHGNQTMKISSLSDKLQAADEKQYDSINEIKAVNSNSNSRMIKEKYYAEVTSIVYMSKAQIKQMITNASNDGNGDSLFIGYAKKSYWNDDCVKYDTERFCNAKEMRFDWR